MTQFGEMVRAEIMAILGEECLFSHQDGPHNKTNDLSNSSSKLRTNLENADDDSGQVISLTFELDGKRHRSDLGFNAHHILPADASVAKAEQLLKIMKKQGEGDLKGDIGYGVNHAKNGVFLPTEDKWNIAKYGKWSEVMAVQDGYRLLYAYAYAAMMETDRQFHTGHGDYSDWVLQRLEEIKVKMVESKRDCKQNKCKKKKPWNPPYSLVGKLDSISAHVKGYLTGPKSLWLMPLVTSPEAEMLGAGITPDNFLAVDR
jgi:hypothetical protein